MDKHKQSFLAVDLGATSGRTILGFLQNSKIEMEELTRFKNGYIELQGHFFWDIYSLYSEILRGLKTAADRGINLTSIAIDTWGVDFVLIGKDGGILRTPYSYRDPHTTGALEKYFKLVPKERVYEISGIQFMNFNSLFQLNTLAANNDAALAAADKILFLPDALSYLLTGKMVTERTMLSTSSMMDPRTGKISEELIHPIGLSLKQFAPYIEPGQPVGTLTEEIQKLTGLGPVTVIAAPGHDTASAVAAVPAQNEQFAYLSSGTWSLMGIESSKPIINALSLKRNFTNEGGIEGTTRFLKNICGMWIYERCRLEWPDAKEKSHKQLQEDSMQCEPFRSLINPDDPSFANPESMVKAIENYCTRTGQPVPQTPAQFCRCIFESLALRYRQVFTWLNDFADFDITTLHVIGGGSLNLLLDQFTANSCGVTVLTGPVEGTALGNIMVQAKASGAVKDIWEMRRIIARSIEVKRFEPQDKDVWDKAYTRFLEITK